MHLQRDEIAFRKHYEMLVTQQRLTTIFRPGNRIYPNFRGYKQSEIVTARIIETPGSDEKDIAPVFNQVKMPVQIHEITTFNIFELGENDFSGSSPDVQSVDQLIEHLIQIYNKPIHTFDNQVTKISLLYLDSKELVKNATGRR